MALTDKEALDQIAKAVVPEDWGGWCDECGLLETIGDIVRSTGRPIENWED